MECVDVIKPRHQNGFSLTEALVAFTVIAIGLLAVASFQSGLFRQSAHNKAQTEALALAQQKIEQLKHYTLAGEEAYIDEDGDGVMDAEGNYAEDPITGRNAVFLRSWDLGSTDLGSQVEVTVAWSDAENQLQEVSLSADIPWISPRTAADQIVDLVDPILVSPTGRARLGEGHIEDIPSDELNPYTNIYPEDGLEIYQHNEDLLLANPEGEILLTLTDACLVETGTCTDFVRIAGTVYLDTTNAKLALEDIELLASDAAFCKRWVPEGTLSNPPATPSGDYEYYHYTCYLGGGWHGNLGFVTRRGISLSDKVCQGDPTAFDSWKRPVIALRRAYRGMLSRQVNGATKYYSHGIRDAALLTGQDYVFTALAASATEGYHCSDVDAPMTRFDSDSGKLFKDIPTDFVCLNHDDDGDGSPDYLDVFDGSQYSAATICPFDPTSPPVLSYQISGRIDINSSVALDLGNFEVLTSDGPGNCVIEPVSGAAGVYSLVYACTVYDWGVGWTGNVSIRANSQSVFCPNPTATFSALTSDTTLNNSCIGGPTITVEGPIEYLVQDGPIQSITMEEAVTGYRGHCEFISTKFRCTVPYNGISWSGTLSVESDRHVCDSTSNQFYLGSLSMANSPYSLRLTVARSQANCPILESTL
jgi:hypothetical protein